MHPSDEHERDRFAAFLDRHLHASSVVLHARSIPGDAPTADHVVVAPSGIWLVDVLHATGRLQVHTHGTPRAGATVLRIDGKNMTDSIDRIDWRTESVAGLLALAGLAAVSIRRAVCVTGCEWPRESHGFHVHGTEIVRPERFVDLANSPAWLSPETIAAAASAIGSARVGSDR